MIPLNDTEPNRYIRLPFMLLSLIGLNVLVMGWEIWTAATGDANALLRLFYRFGNIPHLLLTRQGGGALTLITSLFLHGGMFHLGGNMLALWVFGRRIEDACGPWRFLLFYLTCGVTADLVHTLVEWESTIPGIGASGAIFGIMGSYLILYPNGRIRAFIPISIVPTFPKIRAIWVVIYFLGVQIIPAINTLRRQSDYHIAHWAHLGGFAAAALIFLFLRPDAFHRFRNDLKL